MLLSIPSPSTGIWYIGPFPLRAYALCIIAGIIIGMVIVNRRWRARGGTADTLETVLVLAIPFGIIGARLYHVATDWELYFAAGRDPLNALKIWRGGLGVWGAVAGGALGAYLMGRRRGVRFPALLDAAAPALLVAQAVGRLGNWFNSELFGRPTTLPWALEIAPQYRPTGYAGFSTFHPTFLYEMVWNLLVAVVLVLLDRRHRLGHGKVFALYVALYCAGRFWIEALRIDTVNEIGGFRLNNYTALIGFLVAVGTLVWLVRHRPGRETVVEGRSPGDAAPGAGAAADGEVGSGEEPGSAVEPGSGEDAGSPLVASSGNPGEREARRHRGGADEPVGPPSDTLPSDTLPSDALPSDTLPSDAPPSAAPPAAAPPRTGSSALVEDDPGPVRPR